MHYVRDAAGSVLAVYVGAAVKEHALYGLGRLGVYYRAGGTYAYQLADHLGNVRAVVMKDGAGALAVTNRTDYYPFGMPMPGRNVEDGQYRYGYQGEFAEKEGEMPGVSSFELRLWDSRIGRWISPDPYGQFVSPYLGMGNNPISMTDPDGGYCPDCPDDGTKGIGNSGDTFHSSDGFTYTMDDVGVWWSDEAFAQNGITINDWSLYWADVNVLAVNLNKQQDLATGKSAGIRAQEKLDFQSFQNFLVFEKPQVTNFSIANSAFSWVSGPGAIGNSSKFLFWGKNAKGHLAKRAPILGFNVSAQVAQKMAPELKAVANQLLNKATPSLTKVGRWHGHENAIMYISEGKMIVTEANGTFITVINKTSNNWYEMAKFLN